MNMIYLNIYLNHVSDEGTGGETFQEDDPALLAEEDLFGEVDASIWLDFDAL